MKNKVDEVSKGLGIVCLILFLVEIVGWFYILGSSKELFAPHISFIILFGFGYTAYKTLYKKQPLSKSEKIAVIFLIGLVVISFSIGFYVGLTQSFQTFTPIEERNYTIVIPNLTEIPKILETKYPNVWLIDNKTITVESESYYVYPIELVENQTVRFVLNLTTKGVFNTIMLNSTEYEKLGKEDYVYYYINSYTSGVRSADLWITVDRNDTYYFIISTMPIVKGQASYGYPIEVVLTVYVS